MLSMMVTPLRALLIALGSVLLAYWWFDGGVSRALAAVAAFILIAVGAAIEQIGRAMINKNNPVAGMHAMEWWVLVPAGLAAVASAVVIIIAVTLAAPEGASEATKELLGALSAGITAFLTTMWIDPSEDIDDTIGGRIQEACFTAYAGPAGAPTSRFTQVLNSSVFADPSPDKNKTVGTVEDWGRSGRALRAKVIAQELSSPRP